MGISLSMENEHLLVPGLDKSLGKDHGPDKKFCLVPGLKVELWTACISPVVFNIFDKNNLKLFHSLKVFL